MSCGFASAKIANITENINAKKIATIAIHPLGICSNRNKSTGVNKTSTAQITTINRANLLIRRSQNTLTLELELSDSCCFKRNNLYVIWMLAACSRREFRNTCLQKWLWPRDQVTSNGVLQSIFARDHGWDIVFWMKEPLNLIIINGIVLPKPCKNAIVISRWRLWQSFELTMLQ